MAGRARFAYARLTRYVTQRLQLARATFKLGRRLPDNPIRNGLHERRACAGTRSWLGTAPCLYRLRAQRIDDARATVRHPVARAGALRG
jgi:hypothetical protein